MSKYLEIKKVLDFPRLPLGGMFDLTFRCNNNCRHCWINLPANSPEKKRELTFDEITRIVDEAKKMGCRSWHISGGEPMLRPDFPDIFDYMTRNSTRYIFNTNGTLITPQIARLLKRKGAKLISLYGASAQVHDSITRHPGSFEALMQGFAYLKECGVDFIVQLVPLRDNFHQFQQMLQLAKTLSPDCRLGLEFLYLSASGVQGKNQEIIKQRLSSEELVQADPLDVSCATEHEFENVYGTEYRLRRNDPRFLACLARRRNFHIDPYGSMCFCRFLKPPEFRYDLRKGTLKECWEVFIPSLAGKEVARIKYPEGCDSCQWKDYCRWCPAYAQLEHQQLSAKVEYLCSLAKEYAGYHKDWQKNHCRYYQIAGMTLLVESDLPITDTTFHPKINLFQVEGPGTDNIILRHHFFLPELNGQDLGQEVYRRPPWAIYKKRNSWIYFESPSLRKGGEPNKIVIFNQDHTQARIYNQKAAEKIFHKGRLESLTIFPSDQIFLARILADRQGCFFHSSGVILDGKGLLFMGHSDAGKSTITRMFQGRATILCDDRIIVRRWPEGFKIHGTWSHGDVAEVSPASAPLAYIFFLEKAPGNLLLPMEDKKAVVRKLLAFLIRPLVTADWWEQTLSLVERMVYEVPYFRLRFNKDLSILDSLGTIIGHG